MFGEYAWLFSEAIIVRTDTGDYEAWQKMDHDPENRPYDFVGIIELAKENLEAIQDDTDGDPAQDSDVRKDWEIITGFLRQHGAL